jgi:hypothetical protein
MILKLIAFIAAVAPILLFLRQFLPRRRPKTEAKLKTFKRQLDIGVNVFLVLVACVMAWALVEVIWTWL